MTNTRIFKVLSNCSVPELNRFLKFVNSPYFNKNESITELAVLIIDSIKTSDVITEKNEIWAKVKGDNEFSDVKYRKLFNELLERFERFLTIETLSGDKLLMSNLLLKAIRTSKHDDLIEKHITQSENKAAREIDQSSDFYLQKYYQLKNIHNIKSNYEKKVDQRKGFRVTYSDLSKNLDAFYSIEKLRLATELSAWQKLYKSEEKIEIDNIETIIETNDLKVIPSVAIYLLMNKIFLSDHDVNDFKLLRELAEENIHHFPKEEQREISDALISYCVKKVNSGQLEFQRTTLQLYDWAIKHEIILYNGLLSPTSFRNYVFMGLRLGEYDKVENFISSKVELLEENRRDNALNFNLARLSFYKKEYSDVIMYLSKLNYDDIWYNLNSKSLLFAAYYELGEFDALDNQIESYQTFLRREKSIDDSVRKMNVNFTKFLKKLYSKNLKNTAVKEKLMNDILNEKRIVSKRWLLEKIKQA